MRVKRAMRASLRGYAMQFYSYNGDAHIGSKVLVDLINDVEDIRHSLLAIANDLRRERPADLTPEESDERIAQVLERLAAEIDE